MPTKNRYARGKNAIAISQRDGGEYPYREMRMDPVAGIWVHKSELDPPDPLKGKEPPYDAINLEHPLPPDDAGPISIDPYRPENGGALGLHFVLGVPTFEYSRHLEHPEDHFYIGTGTRANVLPETWERYELQEGEHQIAMPFTPNADDAYTFIAFHPSHVPTSIHLNMGNSINQINSWGNRGMHTFPDVPGVSYQVWVTGQLWLRNRLIRNGQSVVEHVVLGGLS